KRIAKIQIRGVNVISLQPEKQVIWIFLWVSCLARDEILYRFCILRFLILCSRQSLRQKVNVGSALPAVEFTLFRRVDGGLRAILEICGGSEVNESIIAIVKRAEASRNTTRRPSYR